MVAFLAASVAELPFATITSGLRRTSSAAISESRFSLPCAERYSMMKDLSVNVASFAEPGHEVPRRPGAIKRDPTNPVHFLRLLRSGGVFNQSQDRNYQKRNDSGHSYLLPLALYHGTGFWCSHSEIGIAIAALTRLAQRFWFLAKAYSRPMESSATLKLVANGMPTGKY